MEQDPFPLYPGEVLTVKVTPLTVVIKGTALKLRATRDFIDSNDVKRVAGEMWLFEGPGKLPHISISIYKYKFFVFIFRDIHSSKRSRRGGRNSSKGHYG